MPIVRYIYRIARRRNIFQFTGLHQFAEDAASGGCHLCTYQLKFPTGEDRVMCKVFRQFLIDLFVGHRHGVRLVLRTTDFLLSQTFLQLGIGTEGDGFELDSEDDRIRLLR